MRYAEIGAHAKECLHKPSSDLDPLVSDECTVSLFLFSDVCFCPYLHIWLLNSSTLVMKSFVSLQEVTQTNWYRKYFASSNKLDITTDHTLEVRTGHVCGHTKDLTQECFLIFD